MRKIFNEYGGWAVIVFVIAVLLLLVGGIKSIDDNGKVKGSGLIATIGNIFSNSIEKNNNHLRYLNGECGPNGEPLVSTTESQVGKYADIDGDGTVDGIIFADLAVGGSGTYEIERYYQSGLETLNYYIPKKNTGLKTYYQKGTYTDKMNGTQEVIVPLSNGSNRFYIMSLKSINNGKRTTLYNSINENNVPSSDYLKITKYDFGSGKENTLALYNKWLNENYGLQDINDAFNFIHNDIKKGWFIPSSEEWAVFYKQLHITKENYVSKGIEHWIFTSSVTYSYAIAYMKFEGNNVYYSGNPSFSIYTRLATTF